MLGADEVDSVTTSQLERFFQYNFLWVVVAAGVFILIFLLTPRFVPRVVRRAMRGKTADFEDGGVTAVELEKRATTIEHLTITLIRAATAFSLAFIVIGVFGAWSLLTGVGLFVAAVTLAGQSIVLDYLMGVFIVVEGTYFEGDNIATGDPGWEVLGVVETVALRRTVIRGPDGTVHSVSNGLMRRVSNRTRVYAAAEVHVRGIREEDLDLVIETVERVGLELATEGEFAASIVEPHTVKFLGNPDELGWSVKVRAKVAAGQRWDIASE
ncbi:MAG: mechanosensitive ion channel family protein, partial [Actinomycetota bacterium]|nr:mechanosensitive ion channel family protein [Actinomycetota bacterium]